MKLTYPKSTEDKKPSSWLISLLRLVWFYDSSEYELNSLLVENSVVPMRSIEGSFIL